ncbi:hypothetical protein KVP10_11780 [Candidimonas humi]|jgi:hypothetical protein|uniref:Uncharacterized protein n=1 Tax=Candidimonas humi TaxID=683355 RepID=A0ABV8NZK2_9BURK|nr:hypothetical protein [Candidimonas humi]MBV6305570.1 hypothetical protein [Candidimonas humi]
MLNLKDILIGQNVRLKNGAIAEVTENMGDGLWLQLRDPQTGDEDLVHCEEVVELVSGQAS